MRHYAGKKKPDMARYVFIFIMAGAVLRALGAAFQGPPGTDEFFALKLAEADSIAGLIRGVYSSDMNSPLWYMLNYFIFKILGFSEITIRLLPFLFGTVCMAVFYRMTRAFFSESISLVALFLFAFNPYQIYYSAQAGMHTMFLMTSMLMVYYFLMSIKYNVFLKGPFIFWAAVGIYTSSFSLIIIMVLNAVLLLKYRDEIRMKEWGKSMGIIALLAAPLIPVFLNNPAWGGYPYEPGFAVLLTAPFYTLKNYLFGISLPFNPIVIGGLAAMIYFILLGRFTYREHTQKMVDIIFTTAVFLVLFFWIMSFFQKNVYSDESIIVVSALIIILLAAGISYLSRPASAMVIVVMACFYGAALYNQVFDENYKNINYAPGFDIIKEDFKGGDIIIHSNTGSYAAYGFYKQAGRNEVFENRLLERGSEKTGWVIKEHLRGIWLKFAGKALSGESSGEHFFYKKDMIPEGAKEEVLKKYKRIWFVRDNKTGIKHRWMHIGAVFSGAYEKTGLPEPGSPEDLGRAARYFKDVKEYRFSGNEVYLLERR